MNKIKIFTIIISALLIFQSCSQKEAQKKTENNAEQKEILIAVSQKQFQKNGMKTGKAEYRKFEDKIRTNGKIILNPDGKAYVNSSFSGIIKRIFVKPGQKTANGQKLCSITSIDIISLQQQFSEAANKLYNLKQNYIRKKSLFEEKVISEREFDKAKSEYFGALGNYNGLKQKVLMMKLNPEKIKNGKIYSEIYLTSPINGYLTSHNCVIGQSVSEGDNLFEIINTKKMQLEFYVFEKDVPKINIGNEVLFFTPDNENITYKGKITVIGKSVDTNTKTVKCYAETDNKKIENLAENMYMNVDIVCSDIKKQALPNEAIVTSENLNYVLVLQNKDQDTYYFKKKEIKTGQSYDKYTEILENDTNLTYLLKGAYNLITE